MLVLTTKNIEFIPSKFKDEEKPPTFILRPPTFETSLKIQQILLENVGSTEGELKPEDLKVDTVKLIKTAILDSVVGWKNIFYQGEKGELKELPFSKENFMFLNDLEVILEIYNKINEMSLPLQKQDKN